MVIRGGANPIQLVVSPKKREICTEMQGEEGHVQREVESRVTQPQAKEWPRLPEAGRAKAGPSPRGLLDLNF